MYTLLWWPSSHDVSQAESRGSCYYDSLFSKQLHLHVLDSFVRWRQKTLVVCYWVSKKVSLRLCPVTSLNANWFSHFFHCKSRWLTCDKVLFKDPTTLMHVAALPCEICSFRVPPCVFHSHRDTKLLWVMIYSSTTIRSCTVTSKAKTFSSTCTVACWKFRILEPPSDWREWTHAPVLSLVHHSSFPGHFLHKRV